MNKLINYWGSPPHGRLILDPEDKAINVAWWRDKNVKKVASWNRTQRGWPSGAPLAAAAADNDNKSSLRPSSFGHPVRRGISSIIVYSSS